MPKNISKTGAANVVDVIDRLASLLEENHSELNIPGRVAADMTARLDRVSDHIENTFGLKNDTRQAAASNGGFDPHEIADQEAGPHVHDQDEAGYMGGNFTEQEHGELSRAQQNREQGLGSNHMASEEEEEGEEMKHDKKAAIAQLLRAAADLVAADEEEKEDDSDSDDEEEEEESEEDSDSDDEDEEKEAGKKASYFGFDLYA